MRIRLFLAFLASAPGISLEAQQVILEPEVLFGVAMERGQESVPVGGLGLSGITVTEPWSGSLGYRWLGFGRSCEGDWPRPCNAKTPGGHMFLLGLSVSEPRQEGISLVLGTEIGVAHLQENAEFSWGTFPTAALRATLRSSMSAGHVDLGAMIQWTPPATLVGLTVGVGVSL